MDWLHWILFIGFCIMYFVAAYFYDKTRDQKKKTEYYKKAYHEAKEAWVNQSNAIREKALECGYLDKANRYLEKQLKELKKRLKDNRTIL